MTSYALARVERAEAAVRRELAAVRNLRVRDLGGDRASVEVDAALLPLGDALEARVLAAVREAGFAVAEVDPRGFRSGSMNEVLSK